ncbi:hypothetical protein [Glycomyces sp. NPDC048151]|uniref:hypothetical protein n=1 Tax=Glycomyces sp. NPDC048151 TaxID=3364002 RepID=UPI00371C4830
MHADYPYGPKEPGRIEKTLDIAAKILDDPFPDPDDDLRREPTPREIGRTWVEHWRDFSGGENFAYRGGVSAPGFDPGERLAAFLDDMRALRLPLNEVTGLCEGSWDGVPFTTFDTLNFGAAGTHWPYRFVCTPVRDERLEVVHDQALRKRRPYHVEWYPRLGEYKLFTGPWNEPDSVLKVPGALKKHALGRGFAKAVEGAADRLTMPKLHTTSLDKANALAAVPFERDPFYVSWAVRGRWLMVFRAEARHVPAEPESAVASLLNALTAVHRLWESAR